MFALNLSNATFLSAFSRENATLDNGEIAWHLSLMRHKVRVKRVFPRGSHVGQIALMAAKADRLDEVRELSRRRSARYYRRKRAQLQQSQNSDV